MKYQRNWTEAGLERLRAARRSERGKCHVVRDLNWFMQWVEKTDGCWLWTGNRDKDGYGFFQWQLRNADGVKKIHSRKAHRYSWTLHCGEIPAGLSVLHHCDNPPCVRPDHLFTGTKLDNNHDRSVKGRTHSNVSLETVRRIKEMIRDGMKTCSISRELEVKYHVVHCIRSGVTFSWLTV